MSTYARAVRAATCAVALLGFVTACSSEPGAEQIAASEVALPNGQTVTCVTYTRGSRGAAISCDWK